MSLIKKYGSYEQAVKTLWQEQEEGYPGDDIARELLEYRRENNIFEPDDYIIHDGELKVFAMWSSAVEGCAYIGYAYAENGEMAHKDEFRHATDEEIQIWKNI